MVEILYFIGGLVVGIGVIRSSLKQKYEIQIDAIENEANIKITSLQTQNNLNIEHYEDKIKTIEDAKEQMKQEFEKLSNKIFESTKKESSSNLTLLLKPFKEQLESFKSRVNEIYTDDTKQRNSLIAEIKNLNDQINVETLNVNKVFEEEKDIQNDYGEMNLSEILKQTGLTQGKEYSVQGSFTDKSGKKLKPNVILHLAENKDIVIDSKVSMSPYLKFVNSENEDEKEMALNELVNVLEMHIKQLSNKKYENIKEIKALDFILMFIPIEEASILASSKNTLLFKTAFEHNIMLVSPSTLFVTLRIIKNIWQYKYQSENAQLILRKASALYDNFQAFVTDMEDIGKYIYKTKQSYEIGLNKLSTGRGNLVRRAEELKNLGVKSKNKINSNIIEESKKV